MAAVGKILNGRDLTSTSSFTSVDHLIPKHSRNINKIHSNSTGNAVYERRFFFANKSPQVTLDERDDDNAEMMGNQHLIRDINGGNNHNHMSQIRIGGGVGASTEALDSFRNPRHNPPQVVNRAATAAEADATTGDDLSNEEAPPSKRGLLPFDLPQEFPLTRTVSTSTDLNQNSDSELNYCGIFTTRGILKGQSASGGGSKNDVVAVNPNKNPQQKKKSSVPLRRSTEELFNEFCKKTGRLIRPKNIYYIDNRHEEEEPDDETEVNGRGTEIQKVGHVQENAAEMRMAQIRRSKSFQSAEFLDQPPMYYSHFDRRRPSPRHMMMYQSQTLPRNFRKTPSQTQVQIPHMTGQFCGGNGFVNRSFDNFLSVHMEPSAFYPMHPLAHPAAQQQQQQHHHNWPKCIPSSPRVFYPVNGQQQTQQQHRSRHGIYGSTSRESLNRQEFNNCGNGGGSAFDLDEMEKECRRSHKNLFQGHSNGFILGEYSKSTAV